MTNNSNSADDSSSRSNSWRDWFAASLGVRGERKAEIYLDLSKSATLRDTSYWLQILFSSGIAIFGMVLNSTAVVIGAMLISPLTKNDRRLYLQKLASRLGIEQEKIDLRLIEIPTTSSEFLARSQKLAQERIQSEADKLFTEKQKSIAARMREHSLLSIRDYFKNIELPTPAEFVNYEMNINGSGVPQIKIVYLSIREIDGNRQISIADEIQSRIEDSSAKISFERIEPLVGTISFDENQAQLSDAALALLDRIGNTIQQNRNLKVEIGVGKDENENSAIIGERAKSITDYLASKWQTAFDRSVIASATDSKRGATLRIKLDEQMPLSTNIKN